MNDREVLEKVLEISRQMAETRELGPLLHYVMEQSINLTRGQHGYLVLLNEDGTLDFHVVYGQPDTGPQNQRVVSRTIIEEVIRTREPVLIKNALEDNDFSEASSVIHLRLRSVLCVPLISQQILHGVIYIENRHAVNAFTEANISPLVIFASQAAVAIQNAKLNMELQAWAQSLEARIEERTRELQEARDLAEQNWQMILDQDRQRTTLLGNIAHDIRSPLNTVYSSLTMMLDGYFGEVSEAQATWIHNSLRAVQQVMRLAGDVLDLTKIEQGRLSFEPRPVELLPILSESVAIAEGLKAMDSEVELVLSPEEGLPQVMADPDRLRQILINLLANAIKFTKEGEVGLNAYLSDKGQYVVIEVYDTGAGIPTEDIPYLFQRFRQAANQDKAITTGTGLGLAISKQLVEQHGGFIDVESVPGQGSRFYFTLPVAQPA
jgi:signal transduction histidine kinase